MNKKSGLLQATVLTLGIFHFSNTQAQTVCAFDLGGASGDNYAFLKDYALAAKKWGVELELKAYNSEDQAIADFKARKCDALTALSFGTMQFNQYASSISAMGAIPTYSIAKTVLSLMGNPKVATDMVQGEYEVAGIMPIGFAYFVVKDRNINTLAKAAGKRIGVLSVDPVQRRMVQKVGAIPVGMSVDNAGELFRTSKIDILPSPAIAYVPFEVYCSMGYGGGVARFPISFLTGNFVIYKDAFPAGFGQNSRSFFASNINRQMKLVERYESSVPAKYWYDISNEDTVGYLQLLRQMRIEFVKNGTYSPKMMALMKKLRCQQDPSSFECALKDE